MTLGKKRIDNYGIYSIMAFGQDNKGEWWMPWHIEAMKDVASCDKPREGANNL